MKLLKLTLENFKGVKKMTLDLPGGCGGVTVSQIKRAAPSAA